MLMHSPNPDLSLVGRLTDHITHLKSHVESLDVEHRETAYARTWLTQKLSIYISRCTILSHFHKICKQLDTLIKWKMHTNEYMIAEARIHRTIRKSALRRGFRRLSQLGFRGMSVRAIRYLQQWRSVTVQRINSRRAIELWVRLVNEQ